MAVGTKLKRGTVAGVYPPPDGSIAAPDRRSTAHIYPLGGGVVHELAADETSGTTVGSASVKRIRPASGTSAGTSTSAGALKPVRFISGVTVAGVTTPSGQLTDILTFAGSCEGSTTSVASALACTVFCSGTCAGVMTQTGDLYVIEVYIKLDGTSAGSTTQTGLLTTLITMTGVSAGVTTNPAAQLIVDNYLAGTSAGVCAVSVPHLYRIRYRSGTSAGVTATTGAFRIFRWMVGTSAGVTSQTGLLKPIRGIKGTSAGVLSQTGAVNRDRCVKAAETSGTVCSGTLATALVSLAGTCAGVTAPGGILQITCVISGVSDGCTDISGVLSLLIPIIVNRFWFDSRTRPVDSDRHRVRPHISQIRKSPCQPHNTRYDSVVLYAPSKRALPGERIYPFGGLQTLPTALQGARYKIDAGSWNNVSVGTYSDLLAAVRFISFNCTTFFTSKLYTLEVTANDAVNTIKCQVTSMIRAGAPKKALKTVTLRPFADFRIAADGAYIDKAYYSVAGATTVPKTEITRSVITSGQHNGGNGSAILRDSTKSFELMNILVGDIAKNVTDGSQGTITDISGSEITAPLSGGTDNDWDTGDQYQIQLGGTVDLVAKRFEISFASAGQYYLTLYAKDTSANESTDTITAIIGSTT